MLTTTIIWIVVTFATSPESKETLRTFYKRIQPGGAGWQVVVAQANAEGVDIVDPNAKWTLPSGILAMFVGTIMIYSLMFSLGKFLFGETQLAIILALISSASAFILLRIWKKLGKDII